MAMNLKEFYLANPARRISGEADYGVWWKDDAIRGHNYRVSYIRSTGEIYAVNQSTQEVEILGVVPADKDPGILYYDTLDGILEGWAKICGKRGSLNWVRIKLQQAADGY
jgi:hypothetical protein